MSAGAGHIRAAEALERAFLEVEPELEVRHVDTLLYTNKLFRHLYSKAYIDMVNKMPEVLGWLYDHLDKPWKNERRRLALDKLNTRPFIKMLKEYRPDITVCTHFLPAEIISWLKAKQRISCRQSIVVTDFDVHAMWLCRHYENYFVALDETRLHLAKLGIPEEKITVSGIPIDPTFARQKDRRQMREKHGLKQDVTTILLSAGGFGVGPVEHIVKSLKDDLRSTVQVVVLCGRNQKLKDRIDRLAGAPPDRLSIKTVGYTTEVDELMSASDILLGKPGGLTTSEALAKGLIFVIVNPIPGQEERNSDHLLEEGVAIRCNNLPVLADKIDRLLNDPARMQSMRANSARLARPNAALDIARQLLSA
ncbi:MAG: processive 1,2-diacylglycerol beta-glucosyltransferase [Acidobacteriota bacterium]|nr:processive 1,2-diacylglycerol beta-glucosyltransferase [Acidobacteriota bacterium]